MPVLRFDYFGTGESSGDEAQADLKMWQRNVLAADAQLRLRTGCAETIWLGIRLGGTLSVLTAIRADVKPKALVVWEPVLNGFRYLETLRRDQKRALEFSYGPLARRLKPQADEVIGFQLGCRLRDQLASILIEDLISPVPVTVLMPMSESQEVVGKDGVRGDVRFVDLKHSFDWTAEEALNTALVPAEAMALIIEELRARA